MNSLRTFLLCVLVMVLAASLVHAAEESKEKKLTRKDLPAAMLAAFERDYPKARIQELGSEVEDSLTLYEIESKDGGTLRTVTYTADGKLHEIEERMAYRDLPKVVTDSLTARCAKGKPVRVEKITRGATTEYELIMTCPKHTKEVVIDASGHILKMEAVDKKDED